MENTFGYFAKDVAAFLDVTTSTLRRWSIELEKYNYHFERNDKDRRIYFERDFAALRELKKLIGNNVPFADAIKAVASTDIESKNIQQTPSVYDQEIRLSKREFEEVISEVARRTAEETAQAIQQRNEELEKRLDNYQYALDESLKQRDEKLMETLNEMQESKQNEKRGFLSKLFGIK